MHPALQRIYLLKSASESVSTNGAAAAYGAATRSLMNGASSGTGKVRHPRRHDPLTANLPEHEVEAQELGHPVSSSPEAVTEALKSRIARGDSNMSKEATASKESLLLAHIAKLVKLS